MKDLATKTVKELREIAKGLNIKGRWDMTKEQLINEIEGIRWSEAEIVFETDCVIPKNTKTNPEGLHEVTKTTLEYLNNAEVGTLVAFKRNSSKDIAMSGKFISFDGSKVTIESKRGTMFKVSPENIIWVKTGTRWPKWVFALFNKETKEVEGDNAIS